MINILHYLEYWRLVKKDEYTGEWYLLTNHIIELRNAAEYQTMLEHSRFLLPAIYKILETIGTTKYSAYLEEYKDLDKQTYNPLLGIIQKCLIEHLNSGYSETVIRNVGILYKLKS